MLKLYFLFFYISISTFGGGYSVLPILKRELVSKRKEITEDELLDFFAIAQSTPGVIIVNTATLIGAKKKGKMGGAVATLGVITPSIILTIIFGSLIGRYGDNEYLSAALKVAGITAFACVTVSVAGLVKKEIKLFYVILITVALSALGAGNVIIVLVWVLIGILLGTHRKKDE